MKRLNLLGTAIMLGLFFAAAVSAKTVECDNTHGAGSMKSKVCEMLNAENELINELEGYVDNACKNKNSASCDSLVMRKNKLKNVQDRAHEENNSLEENDFQEMIEGAYKGKNKKDGTQKTCKKIAVEEAVRDEILDDLEIGIVDDAGFYDFFKASDEAKALDDKCNSWKIVWLEHENPADSSSPFVKAAPPVKINEEQEGLCQTECKGKNTEVLEKRARFDADLDDAIEHINVASVQLAKHSQEFAVMADFYAVQQNDSDSLCPPRPGTLLGDPIHTSVVMTAYVASKALEISNEICEHPANQDVLGNNGAAACTPLEVGYRIAKEVYDMMEFLNADFQGAQIEFIENCVEKMGDTIAEIKDIVQRIETLVVTPQGKRQTELLDWPNKEPVQ
ncbi:MAG: hypothetical protein R3297_05610 [Desulfobulbales bacterium]|nr:hypothetical protein [Desulfobulbales bacterium]